MKAAADIKSQGMDSATERIAYESDLQQVDVTIATASLLTFWERMNVVIVDLWVDRWPLVVKALEVFMSAFQTLLAQFNVSALEEHG